MAKFQPLPQRQQALLEPSNRRGDDKEQANAELLARQWYQWFQLVEARLNILGGLPAPTSSAGAGTPGQYAYDANFLYLCIATNSWKRIPLLAF